MRVLIFIGTLICCGSCASLSPQYLSSIEKEKETTQLEVGRRYVFRNYPYDIKNLMPKPIPTENTGFAGDMLWRHIEPKFKVENTEWFKYRVQIDVKSVDRIEFSLIDSLGGTIKKRNQKYTKKSSFCELKPKFWFWNNYIVINGFNSKISAFSLDREGNLIVPEHFTDGAFLIAMPFAGSQHLEVYKYRE